MNFSIFLTRLKVILIRLTFFWRRPKISLLIPFSTNDPQRKRILKWLRRYWRHELPYAEVIIGRSNSKPFCKNHALNNAAKKARGRVLVTLDSDAYIEGSVIEKCADKILDNLDNHLWYVPYRHLHRLTKGITEDILNSNPANPLRVPTPPSAELIDGSQQKSVYGHRYGAMIMIYPREALDTLGGFDERFKGWGGEDVAFLRALDTLYGKHKITKHHVLHLWHPTIGNNYKNRQWEGQTTKSPNNNLAMRYHRATRHPSKMRKLVDEALENRK